MELSKYIFPLRKWWWLLVASTLVATIFSSLTVLRQPKMYQARTTLMIGTTIDNPNPSSNDFLLSQQLAAAYAGIANRESVRIATKESLKLSALPQYVARAIPNSHLIEIAVTDTDRERSILVANELAAQLILLSPSGNQPEELGHQEFTNEQLKNLETQINQTEDEIAILQEELGGLISAIEIEEAQNRLVALQSKLNTLQNTYGLLLSNTQQGAANTLTILEPAGLTASPIGSNKVLTIILAAFLGFVLAACEAYLLEYLDGTLKTADEAERLFSVPILGRIFEQEVGENENFLSYASDLHHPAAEAFRALRTHLELLDKEHSLLTILVTSADIGDGKTSVAANLSIMIAKSKKRVVLIDADWRRPRMHKVFNFPFNRGLGDILMGNKSISDSINFVMDRKLTVITAGETPPNPSELLSSDKFDQMLSSLGKVADVVIIDGPPFIVTDAEVLASKVDGVLFVVRPGHTRLSLARSAVEKINLISGRLIGVILNRIPLKWAGYYAGNSALDSYYLSGYGLEGDEFKNWIGSKKLLKKVPTNGHKADGPIKQLFKTIFKPSTK